MKLVNCMPKETDSAKQRRVPLVIAGGTVEYHGPHCAYGCDGIIVERLLDRLAETKEIMIAPSIWYSPSSYAVGGRESGTVHVEEDAFEQYCYYVFKSLLYSGFRNIYVVIHHQFEQENLMPMTLSYMKAAKKATMRFLEETEGEGWWGGEQYRDYYSKLDGNRDPFSWIKVIPTMTAAVQNATGYDHAGLYETSFLMYLAPESVDLARLGDRKHWFTASAEHADAALGEKMTAMTLKSLSERIV